MATEFAIKYNDRLFKNTPIVFLGVSKAKSQEVIKKTDNIAGVVERPNTEKTLKTAL